MKRTLDVCPMCGHILAVQDKIVYIDDTLYCSKNCAVTGIMSEVNMLSYADCKTYAQLRFDAYANEITPVDAGIAK